MAVLHVVVLPLSGGVLDGSDDFVVAGAAAEIAREVEADFVFGRLRVLGQEPFALHDEAGSADAALQRGSFEERLLDRVQPGRRGDAFDRANGRPFGLDGQHEAAIDRSAIHDDRARSAVAVRATFLRAGQVHVVSQDFEQRLSRLAQEFGLVAVESGRDDSFLGHIHSPRTEWFDLLMNPSRLRAFV